MHRGPQFTGILLLCSTVFQYSTGSKLTRAFTKNNLLSADHTEDELGSISLEVTKVSCPRTEVLLFFVFNSYPGTAKAYLISKFLLLCSLAQGKDFWGRKRTLKTKHADLL